MLEIDEARKQRWRFLWLEYKSKVKQFFLQNIWISNKKFLQGLRIERDPRILDISWKYSVYNPFGFGRENYTKLLKKVAIVLLIFAAIMSIRKCTNYYNEHWVTPDSSTYNPYYKNDGINNYNYPPNQSQKETK